MVDKCPKCGETLITRNIQKKMGLGSIDLPVAQICPKCNWSRDLTGAADIVAKPPVPGEAGTGKEIRPQVRQAPEKPVPAQKKPEAEKPRVVFEKTRRPALAPEKRVIDTNKMITIILAVLVIAGIAWTFMPRGGVTPTKDSMPVSTPTPTVTLTPEPTPIKTVTPEITPTGNNIPVKIDRDRGYYNLTQKTLKIKPGDNVVWENVGSYYLILISRDGLFEDILLNDRKRTNYTFKKPGTFGFDIKVGSVIKFNGTVIVEP